MFLTHTGYYVPQNAMPNAVFRELSGVDSDWIEQRTGILSRFRASEDENVNTMAIAAVDDLIKDNTSVLDGVDLIVSASYCIYDSVATPAHIVQRNFAINNAKALQLTSACSSFINGLEVIEGYFASGKATKALLISSEHNSYFSNDKDPKAGHLWGDGAVVWLISKERQSPEDFEILSIYTEGLGNVGKGENGVRLRTREEGIEMPDGRDVFIHACRYMIHALDKALPESGISREHLDAIICHQANGRIVAQVAHQLQIPLSKFINNISNHGNTGSASSALVLAQNIRKFPKNSIIGMAVFGGGYSCGAAILKN